MGILVDLTSPKITKKKITEVNEKLNNATKIASVGEFGWEIPIFMINLIWRVCVMLILSRESYKT